MSERSAPAHRRTLNRRDFLLLRTEGRERVLELSCEQLYVRFTDATWEGVEDAAGLPDADPWIGGEPPARLDRPRPEELFAELKSDLERVDVVRVHGGEWLSPGRLRDGIHALLDEFRARGGRVRFLGSAGGEAR